MEKLMTEKSKHKTLKTNKGITLIALVITIIVMLILVAVTISMAINGGLFDYAGKAVSDTQNAINAEQQLANGKIKIGDKWYASIDDYINNNPITTGIEVNPAEIALKKNAEGAEGTEVLNGTITASVFGMESEPEITWEKSSDAITLSATTGKTVTVGVAETQTEALEATVTAKCTYEGEDYTAECKVTLEMIKPVITASVEKGAFVEYNVEYTDVYYDAYEYSSTNGWRLLDYTPNDDGTIKDVKLISTGIPANLYYYYNDTTNSSWYVTTESDLTAFKNVLGGESNYTFYTGDSTYYGLQASAGLYNNFGDIKFVYGKSEGKRSKGFYTSITANGTTYNSSTTGDKTGNDLFKVGNNVEKVRLLTLKELNEAVGRTDIDSTTTISRTEDSIGLFRVDKLSTVLSGYTYSSGAYWLASPFPDASYSNNVCYVNMIGNVLSNYNFAFGVRPVVILDSDISFSVSADKDATKNVTYLKLTPAS